LQELQRSVRLFAETGEPPPPLKPRGPQELRQLAQQFDAFAAQRVQQDDARAMMLAGISHDLRSPLGRIRMAAELLPEAPGVAARREALRNAQLADELVGSFIALVRTATEPLDERVELHALVRELLGNGDHADVHARLPAEGEALWVEPASRIVLQRCLLNLLDNARRYGRPPLEVDLQAQGRGRAERARPRPGHASGAARNLAPTLLPGHEGPRPARHRPGPAGGRTRRAPPRRADGAAGRRAGAAGHAASALGGVTSGGIAREVPGGFHWQGVAPGPCDTPCAGRAILGIDHQGVGRNP
jgi:hypothetical protein